MYPRIESEACIPGGRPRTRPPASCHQAALRYIPRWPGHRPVVQNDQI